MTESDILAVAAPEDIPALATIEQTPGGMAEREVIGRRSAALRKQQAARGVCDEDPRRDFRFLLGQLDALSWVLDLRGAALDVMTSKRDVSPRGAL
jgi:hypothetical protein